MPADPHDFDAVILGGGAAGLMCAIEAGLRGRKVAVIERAAALGKKILISGGGRCNFTNLHCQPQNFLSANPHFAKSALARYTPPDFIALVEKHRIPYHEKTLGQLFCDRSSRDILNLLEEECRQVQVQFFLSTQVTEVAHADKFMLFTNSGKFRAPVLVVATGGLSIPKIGATSLGYDIARQFGLGIVPPRPALVPLVFAEEGKASYADLAGVSAEIVASLDGQRFREKMLITHRGLSGPAILQISSYWTERAGNQGLRPVPICIDLAPDCEVTASLRQSTVRNLASATAALQAALPARLASRWVELHEPASWTNPALAELERQIHAWEISPAGTEGFEKAEVTAGGVDTDELSAKTMESKKVQGLYFIGEVVDVTGHLGGFNFQWAWASGAAAGRGL
jgi:predicted Rossmann fold flavoprotein